MRARAGRPGAARKAGNTRAYEEAAEATFPGVHGWEGGEQGESGGDCVFW